MWNSGGGICFKDEGTFRLLVEIHHKTHKHSPVLTVITIIITA